MPHMVCRWFSITRSTARSQLNNNANPDGSLNPIGSVAVEVADGSVMIGGSEQSTQVDPCFEYGTEYNPCPYWVDDMGTVSITVNGLTKTVGYWTLDNVDGFLRYDGLYYYNQATSIASGLANAFNADPASPAVASVQGSMIFFTSKIPGAGVNYGLSTAVSYNDTDFSSSSFTATASGPTL